MRKIRTTKIRREKVTQISISLPTELVKIIDEMAAAENRNRSNFIFNVFKRMSESSRTQG